MLEHGVLHRICTLITDYSNLDLPMPALANNNKARGASVTSLDMFGAANCGTGDQSSSPGDDERGRKKFIVGGGNGTRKPGRRSSTQQANANGKRVGQKRPGSAESVKNNGVGYGRGSTKSRWK